MQKDGLHRLVGFGVGKTLGMHTDRSLDDRSLAMEVWT